MKKIFLLLISLYQKIFSVIIKNTFGISGSCRYSPTCSQYAKQSVQKYGAFKGLRLSIVRIISCQPFNKNTI